MSNSILGRIKKLASASRDEPADGDALWEDVPYYSEPPRAPLSAVPPPVPAGERRKRASALPRPPAPVIAADKDPEWDAFVRRTRAASAVPAAAGVQAKPDRPVPPMKGNASARSVSTELRNVRRGPHRAPTPIGTRPVRAKVASQAPAAPARTADEESGVDWDAAIARAKVASQAPAAPARAADEESGVDWDVAIARAKRVSQRPGPPERG